MLPALVFIMAQAANVYSFELIEQYLEQKDYEQALFLTRVNMGLYSEAQLPILAELIKQYPRYYYLKLSVSERAYGAGSSEAVKALLELSAWQVAVSSEPVTLFNLLQRYERQADTEPVEIDLLLGKARVGVAVMKMHMERPLAEYRTQSGSIYGAMDERGMEVARAYSIVKRALDDAKVLVERHREKAGEYNKAVGEAALLIGQFEN